MRLACAVPTVGSVAAAAGDERAFDAPAGDQANLPEPLPPSGGIVHPQKRKGQRVHPPTPYRLRDFSETNVQACAFGRIVMRVILAAAVLLCCAQFVRAAPPDPNELAEVKLLADVSTATPGEPFMLGVQFKLKPGWHIYWLNPGDSGQPPEMTWKAPRGLKISPPRFSVPKSFEQAGGIVGYGYEDEVVLTASAQPEEDLTPGAKLRIDADVAFLVCDESTCVPGKASVSIEIPVGSESARANAKLFDAWVQKLPRPAGDASGVVMLQARPVMPGPTMQTIVVAWNGTAENAEWFPPPTPDITFSDIQVRTDKSTTTVTFKAESLAKKSVIPVTLESVLAYTEGGQRKGLLVPVEIVEPPDAAAKSSQR
jgi:thiol:disulfide interchange protein DsbD